MGVPILGKYIAQRKEEEQKSNIEELVAMNGDRPPCLVVVTVGDDEASKVYVRNKLNACKRVGINAVNNRYPSDITTNELLKEIQKLNTDYTVDAIIVQLPLPEHISPSIIAKSIVPFKDVDCFTDVNRGKLFDGWSIDMNPCTAEGVIQIIESCVRMQSHGIPNYELAGKHVVVVGRSNIVGKPLAVILMTEFNCTVTVCNSHTNNLADYTKTADVLVVAIGNPQYITADMVKKGAIVVDVGINRLDNGKLCGDVDFEEVKDVAGYITPVPNGVGPMTVSCLIDNVITAYCEYYEIREGSK